jgi:ubiquinone/menaquinone biosynthesis C-methylase UbiE
MPATDLPRPRFARMYMRTSENAERRGGPRGLRAVGLGAGHGLHFPHYPDAVTEVIAVEPEPTLRAQATRAAASAPVPIRVFGGTADQLPLEDESVDAAVASLVLCSVPDQDRALAELHRVICREGELHSTST